MSVCVLVCVCVCLCMRLLADVPKKSQEDCMYGLHVITFVCLYVYVCARCCVYANQGFVQSIQHYVYTDGGNLAAHIFTLPMPPSLMPPSKNVAR